MGVYRPSVLPSQYKVMNETFLNTATTEMYDAVSFYTSSGYTAITKALLAGEIKGCINSIIGPSSANINDRA